MILLEESLYSDSSKLIASWSFSTNNDPDYYKEELFRSRHGGYFLYVEGGPRSKYGFRHEGKLSEANYFISLEKKSAKEWSRMKMSPEEYEKEFGKK